MPFQTSNGFNNQNNNASGEKKKTNFPVGRLWGSDAIMNISINEFFDMIEKQNNPNVN
jgi:hypothetical protein